MEHWKQPDKGRHQKQQHQQPQELQHKLHNQNHSQKSQVTKLSTTATTTSDQCTLIQQTDPIQSIANVLNHHHSNIVKEQQKKSQQLEEQAKAVSKNKLDQQRQPRCTAGVTDSSCSINATSQDSNLSNAFSHSSNQIDQGNSYLYAYNDFVTSTARAQSNDVKLACRHRGLNSDQSKEIDNGSIENHESILCEHIPELRKSSLSYEHNQVDSSIDSDEDDALSYILHQHRPRQVKHPAAVADKDTSQQNFLISNHPNHFFQYEGNNDFEAQRIDHHLSCSRSSHPRHICGIGGSHTDNLNNIAARLREESQRAFALNQRSRRQIYTESPQHQLRSNDILDIQSHKFTHDLTIIQDQLANASKKVNSQYNNNQDTISSSTSYNNLNEIHLPKVAPDRKTLLIGDIKNLTLADGTIVHNSINDHSQSAQLARSRLDHHSRRNSPGFLSWLFCCLCHILSPSSSRIQHQQSRANLVHSVTNAKQRYHKSLAADESTGALGMYSGTQQLGPLGGQAGAYYATHTPQSDTLHQAYTNHPHHYPLSSDSSMGSSVFATSALRMNAFFRSCCSKKCLFVSCLVLILLIFIIVVGLSAYLNFLINLNKINLTPMSGRLKVDSQGDSFTDQLSNRTSKEFLAKQQQYETILRGAFDRTQELLKSYPDHLVKCEVYSFKEGSLWIYFRLFINKKTLMQDTKLMKRKSHDEQLEKQFLPRITQQTLHSGFEQLINDFYKKGANSNGVERRLRSSQVAAADFLRHSRTVSDTRPLSQRDHVRSFDDQISLLMPIIESIDLQSIMVTPEFDMLQNGPEPAIQSMSDPLRSSPFLTTPSSPVMVASGSSGGDRIKNEFEPASTTTERLPSTSSSKPSAVPRPTTLSPSGDSIGSGDVINVTTNKFFIKNYKENITRPTTSSKPKLPQNDKSVFLPDLRQPKPLPTIGPPSKANALNIIAGPSQNDSNTTRQSNTLKEIATTRTVILTDTSSKKANGVEMEFAQSASDNRNSLEKTTNITSKNFDDKQDTSKSTEPLVNSDNQSPEYKNNFSTNFPGYTNPGNFRGNTRKDKGVNETVLAQMVAPYQKIEFSLPQSQGTTANATLIRPKDTSIQDLWNNALGNKKNITSKIEKQQDAEQSSKPKRLITVTTIGDTNSGLTNNSNLDWHKISVLSSEISNTIRANMNTPTTTLQPSSILSITTPHDAMQKQPKVSPHLKQGGSLISTPPIRQHHQPLETQSAVVLNRDFTPLNVESHTAELPSNNNSSQQAPTRSNSHHRLDKPLRRPSHGGGQRNTTLSSGTTDDSHKQRASKPANKPNKFKKVSIDGLEYVTKNDSLPVSAVTSAITPLVATTASGAVINSKGIKIVDDFLASLNSARAAELLGQSMNSTAVNKRQNANKTQEAFNYNSDLAVPTLPATIELTRSTTVLPPARTTSIHPLSDGWSGHRTTPSSADHFTTTPTTNQRYSSTSASQEALIKFGVPTNSTQIKAKNVHAALNNNIAQLPSANAAFDNQTPTSSFSSQWKPITVNANNSTITIDESWLKNRTLTRRPNISLIVNNDRLLPIVNVPSNQGSQSPFAMSTSILESHTRTDADQTEPLSQQITRRPNNKVLSNRFQIAGASNEFESHRVSRMRLGDASTSLVNLFGPTQPSISTTSTITNPNFESSTRVVDDFMITTDKKELDQRGPTTPPSSAQIDSHRLDTLARIRAVSPLDLKPKKTRGPFAFETLKSDSILGPTAMSSSSEDNVKLEVSLDEVNLQQRLERSPSRHGADQKLLMRKNLFLGNGEDDEPHASTSSPASVAEIVDINKVSSAEPVSSSELNTTTPERQSDQFGSRHHLADSAYKRQSPPIVNQHFVLTSHSSNHNRIKCQYYGCRAKGSMKFVCLNHTQICDDFIDCQDESDELDCVSMLKHDSKSNQLTFSNGGGIIYLNRKGSLAPMCIDYFLTQSDNRLSGHTNAAHELDAIQLEMVKKQQELIKQINTIGQYACSLQSFSRLVSVKINHHDLVDNMNVIKTSKLYHRLSIVGGSSDRQSSDSQFGSYKSVASEHEVEVSTSTNCPSQRTVFVKCGSFECGQDSFSVIDRNSTGKRNDGVTTNNFPWLVKLYSHGSLTCHGYLIDELWLISSSECFVNKSRAPAAIDDENGWTAEISYEHYGNDDYQSIESNRRNIKDILVRPSDTNKHSVGPSIVLAKLEKPVRFNPLNRPICLPLSATNKTTFELDRMYQDCVTATLPLSGSVSPTQDLLLSKVKIHKATDCLSGEHVELSDDLICVAEMARNDGNSQVKEDGATRVLICSSSQANRSRSKWTVVGVQSKAQGLHMDANKQLFTTVSSQIDWIVDTMNPMSYPNLGSDGNNPSGNELNLVGSSASQNQTCNRFKCSSGECLSWSRICDGLYDCSSHEDEKDCHR